MLKEISYNNYVSRSSGETADSSKGWEAQCACFVACVAADSFPFSGGAEIEQANEKRASEGARLG